MLVLVSAPSLWSMGNGRLSTVRTMSMELKSFSLAILDTIVLAPPTFSAWPMERGAGRVRDLDVEVSNVDCGHIKKALGHFSI